MSAELKVAVCEMTSGDDVETNVAQMLQLLAQLREPGSYDLVCFPENALFMRLAEGAKLPPVTLDAQYFSAMSEWAATNQCDIHIGSVPLLQDGKIYNGSVWIKSSGEITSPYQKIHLFDVDVVGEKSVRESDHFTHGNDTAVLQLGDWKIGSSVCYDVRFSELYAQYARAEVDMILIPSAFLVATGQAHWEILLRARAIESQAYVLAAAQGGEHVGHEGTSRFTYGHSMIVDPWGVVLAEVKTPALQNSQRILTAVLKKDRIEKVRSQVPMKNHRRL